MIVLRLNMNISILKKTDNFLVFHFDKIEWIVKFYWWNRPFLIVQQYFVLISEEKESFHNNICIFELPKQNVLNKSEENNWINECRKYKWNWKWRTYNFSKKLLKCEASSLKRMKTGELRHLYPSGISSNFKFIIISWKKNLLIYFDFNWMNLLHIHYGMMFSIPNERMLKWWILLKAKLWK